MIQLNFNLTLTCTLLAYFPLIFAINSQIAHMSLTCDQNDIPADKNTINKVSKCKPCHKYNQEPGDFAWHKFYIKILYNVYIPLWIDDLIDNSNMAMLAIESGSSHFRIITTHLLFNQLRISIYFTPKMQQLLTNQISHILLP